MVVYDAMRRIPAHPFISMAYLLAKEVGMPSGPFKPHNIAGELVDQQPVRFNVGIPKTAPIALERVIPALWWEGFPVDQQSHQPLDLFHILATLLNGLQVPLKLARIARCSHQIPNCLNKSSASSA